MAQFVDIDTLTKTDGSTHKLAGTELIQVGADLATTTQEIANLAQPSAIGVYKKTETYGKTEVYSRTEANNLISNSITSFKANDVNPLYNRVIVVGPGFNFPKRNVQGQPQYYDNLGIDADLLSWDKHFGGSVGGYNISLQGVEYPYNSIQGGSAVRKPYNGLHNTILIGKTFYSTPTGIWEYFLQKDRDLVYSLNVNRWFEYDGSNEDLITVDIHVSDYCTGIHLVYSDPERMTDHEMNDDQTVSTLWSSPNGANSSGNRLFSRVPISLFYTDQPQQVGSTNPSYVKREQAKSTGGTGFHSDYFSGCFRLTIIGTDPGTHPRVYVQVVS